MNFYNLVSFIFKLNSLTLSISIFSNLFLSFHLENPALMVIKKFIAKVNRPFLRISNKSIQLLIKTCSDTSSVFHEDEQYIKENHQCTIIISQGSYFSR